MFTTVCMVCGLFAGADPSDTPNTPRERHPLAPSLPRLTEMEEAQVDQIIDRFVQYDIGKLPGPKGRQALEHFQNLGPFATFNLIRGLNKAAEIDHSCPALSIGRKLAGFLRTSDDPQLLQYARENIGAGVGRTRHGKVLSDLKLLATQRQAQLHREGGRSLRTLP